MMLADINNIYARNYLDLGLHTPQGGTEVARLFLLMTVLHCRVLP